MGDMSAVLDSIESGLIETALVVGAGYIGLEMADALTVRGIRATQVEALPQVPPAIDPELAAAVQGELTGQGVEVLTGTTVTTVTRMAPDARNGRRLTVTGDPGAGPHRRPGARRGRCATGHRPGADRRGTLGIRGAVVVDDHMRTGVPDVYAAGDCIHTHHRLAPEPGYLPLGTTAHRQGRVAGENAVGGDRAFAGSLGTQVVKGVWPRGGTDRVA
jgi:NADPH-dependent 2,4-dienoyl-CoA reductase/sulfur reductase-like enzyme